MNKYFLAIVSILIVLQSLHVFDEMFNLNIKKNVAYPILNKNTENKNENLLNEINTDQPISKNENKLALNIDELVKNANFNNGIKVSKQCSSCHDFSKKMKLRIGPPLFGIVNKKSASYENFKYSKAMSGYNKKWSEKNLYFFLENPRKHIKGTNMLFKGVKKTEDRIDLILYLKSLK